MTEKEYEQKAEQIIKLVEELTKDHDVSAIFLSRQDTRGIGQASYTEDDLHSMLHDFFGESEDNKRIVGDVLSEEVEGTVRRQINIKQRRKEQAVN